MSKLARQMQAQLAINKNHIRALHAMVDMSKETIKYITSLRIDYDITYTKQVRNDISSAKNKIAILVELQRTLKFVYRKAIHNKVAFYGNVKDSN